MRRVLSGGVLSAIAITSALVSTDAVAQVDGVNLNGRWRCFKLCRGGRGSYAFITQNGWDLNVLNDAGQASRAWVDYPGHIWSNRRTKAQCIPPPA
jgi:hypothetical protein